MPVRVIVPLLWAFVTIAVAIGILASVDSGTVAEALVVLQDLVSCEQPCTDTSVYFMKGLAFSQTNMLYFRIKDMYLH